jgi:hypothetical protein
MRDARKAVESTIAVGQSIQGLDWAFRRIPLLFEGWEKLSMWIKLDDRIKSLMNEGTLARDVAVESLALRLRLALRDYDGYIALLEASCNKDSEESALMRQLREIGRRLQAEKFPDFDTPKVFGIGLSKTGTTSLTAALGILGLHCAHYTNDLTCEILTIDDALLFDALTDIPVCVVFEALYHMFPNSKFIYTVRPLDSWVASFTRHYHRYHRSSGFDTRFRRQLTTRKTIAYGTASTIVYGSLYYHHHDAAAAWAAYDKRVKEFFRYNDSARLLEIDVYSGDGWGKLCNYLNRPIPRSTFPWENKTPALT